METILGVIAYNRLLQKQSGTGREFAANLTVLQSEVLI